MRVGRRVAARRVAPLTMASTLCQPAAMSCRCPACTAEVLPAQRVLHLVRCAVRRRAPRSASTSQKVMPAPDTAQRCAAAASGIFLRATARLEGARDPQSCRSGSPVQSGIGPMIPAYDFSPVGEGVMFLPKGNREGSCARSRLHDSTDLECRGACLLRRSRANPSAVAGPGLREARRSRTATSPNPVPVSLSA